MSKAETKRVNPKDYRYPVDVCLCWHTLRDHEIAGHKPACEVCGQCKRFRRPPANQIMTDKRRQTDITIAEKMKVLQKETARLRKALEHLPNEVPTNWCDSLLTGPDAVMKGEYDCRDIEALLRGIQDRQRVKAQAALDAPDEGKE